MVGWCLFSWSSYSACGGMVSMFWISRCVAMVGRLVCQMFLPLIYGGFSCGPCLEECVLLVFLIISYFTSYYVGIAWLFSIRLLWSRIDPAYCMAMVLIVLNVLNVCFTAVSHMSNCVVNCSIEGACVVPLAPAVMTMSGSTFHPCCKILLIRGWYFWILLLIASGENLSFVYVNSINCIVKLLSGFSGGGLWYGRPLIHISLYYQFHQVIIMWMF